MEKYDGKTSSRYAGKTVKIIAGEFKGEDYRVEDWQPLVYGKSWMNANGNPAALEYAVRSSIECIPTDNHVYYGKIGPYGKMIHASQIQEETPSA